MVLGAGSRLGPYEIVALIGAGGMGEVYRAKDIRLNRDVALKVLPDLVANDPDRLARFRREAQVLASLNHPNIAHLYGFEEPPTIAVGASGTVHALVMELVEGQTLAEVLDQRRSTSEVLPLDDALRIARQIADALEAAHEQGIIHRDLKPANVKVRGDGTVKVLDFGLAKALEPSGVNPDPMSSPTLTARATQLGVILGTAAYMAPEQAKGKVVDRRADIWAFGVVLYEMLTGRRMFDAEDVPDTLAAVLNRQIDWTALPADVPARLRSLLQDCLVRDPKQRLRDIGDARLVLDRILSGAPDTSLTPPAVAAPPRHVLPWVAGLFAAAALASIGTWALVHKPAEPPPQIVRFVVPPGALGIFRGGPARDLAISPDGAHIAYVSAKGNLIVRPIDQIDGEAQPAITEAHAPFFSPDGHWIGFFEKTEMRRMEITGGTSIPVCKLNLLARGASWGPNNTIVFSMGTRGLFTVPAVAGDVNCDPRPITKPDLARHELGHYSPSFLPGGNAILFTITDPGLQTENAQIAVLDLKTGKYKPLIRGGTQAEYVEPGYLVYSAGGPLRAIRFDLRRLEVQGESVPVLAQAVAAGAVSDVSEFSTSRTGTLVYLPANRSSTAARSLVWIDRKGQETPIAAPPRAYYALRLSPNGTRLALDIRGGENNIWVFDLEQGTSTRVTTDPNFCVFPVWTRDGARVIYACTVGGVGGTLGLLSRSADGTGVPEPLTTADVVRFPMSFAPDGRLLVKEQHADTGDDISTLSITGKREIASLISTPFNERNAEVSPNGHWLAYESDESTQLQIYVQPFPQVNNGGRVAISAAGGSKPVWAPSGGELFYYYDNAIYVVPVQTTPSFKAGKPAKLFDMRPIEGLVSGRFYDTHDGQRFVIIKDPPATSTPAAEAQGFVVVLHWVDEVKAKLHD